MQPLRSKGYSVETIENVPGKNAAWDEFEDLVRNKRKIFGPGYRLPREEVERTSFYQLDQAWAKGIRGQGYTFIDVGNPLKKSRSIFLDMEYQHTFDWARRQIP